MHGFTLQETFNVAFNFCTYRFLFEYTDSKSNISGYTWAHPWGRSISRGI